MRESDHLILIASGKIWAKATHSWLVLMSGDNAANTAKVQGYALCLPTKAHGATKNISDNASATSRDCRSKALATAPHLTPPHVVHLSHSSTPKRTKKPPCAQQESQCARRLKERIARRGGMGVSNNYWYNSLSYLIRSFFIMSPISITLLASAWSIANPTLVSTIVAAITPCWNAGTIPMTIMAISWSITIPTIHPLITSLILRCILLIRFNMRFAYIIFFYVILSFLSVIVTSFVSHFSSKGI